MKYFLCLLLIAVALSSTLAGRSRRSGWYPGYGYSAPVVYSRPIYSSYSSYPSYYSGWSGSGWNNGWNGGWKGGWW